MNNKKGENMKKEQKQVDFDLSTLSLTELISLYENINGFFEYLDETKIEESKGEA